MDLKKKYGEKIEFCFIYIQEAHPEDGWQMAANEKQGVVVKEPTTQDQRDEIAATCIGELSFHMTTVVDDMQNTIDNAYCGWPERLYVVGKDGNIAYKGDMGPKGFKPAELDKFLTTYLAEEKNCKETSK